MALVAYFDETGNPKDANIDAFAIGGCVASCEQWLAFDREWNTALADEHLECSYVILSIITVSSKLGKRTAKGIKSDMKNFLARCSKS